MNSPTNRFNAAFHHADEQLRTTLAKVTEITEALASAEEQGRQAQEESDRRFAESARSGDFGDDWQRVQRRIDAHQTSLEDVFSGRDTSPAAQALLAASQKRFATTRKQRQEANTDEDPLTEIDTMREELRIKIARIAQANDSQGERHG